MSRVRAFVGAFLTEASAQQLEAAAHACLETHLEGLRGIRWVPPRNYHVTLKFLGELLPEALDAARVAAAELGGRPLSVRATGFVGLPRSARARLAALALDPQPELTRWWSELAERFGAEPRGFRPHVTVLRLRTPRALTPLPLPEALELTLDAPRLYRSELGAAGSRYAPVG